MSIIKRFDILTYNIGIIEKEIDSIITDGIQKDDIRWLKHSYSDRFFADPFLVKEENGKLYIICEELPFWSNKGVISLLVIDRESFELCSKKTLIEESWHLSFPYLIDGEYILPESHKGGKAYLYHLNTTTWEIDGKELVCAECGFVDPIIIKNETGEEYLLSTDNRSEELYLYKPGKDKMYHRASNGWIVKDKSCARAAGNSFIYKEEMVRPVQDCVERYGRQIRIVKINSIDCATYESTCIAVVNSDKNPPFNETCHTFNVYDNCIIVDGSKDIRRFPMKIIYRVVELMKMR